MFTFTRNHTQFYTHTPHTKHTTKFFCAHSRVHTHVCVKLIPSLSLMCVCMCVCADDHVPTIGGVSGPNSSFPECSVLDILWGDPQCLHIPSDTIHPSPSWSPLGLFPGILMSTTALTSLFSSILCMCPYQRSLISLTFSCILFTPSSFMMAIIFTLSLSVTRLILRYILISVFSRICSSFFLTVQHPAPYRSTPVLV